MSATRPIIWCYAGRKAGPLAEIIATCRPDGEGFAFADSEDRARFRRRLEDAMRKHGNDWDLILVADILGVRMD